jgi:hypothetical protein
MAWQTVMTMVLARLLVTTIPPDRVHWRFGSRADQWRLERPVIGRTPYRRARRTRVAAGVFKPQPVTFNGSSFDLPVAVSRRMNGSRY